MSHVNCTSMKKSLENNGQAPDKEGFCVILRILDSDIKMVETQ